MADTRLTSAIQLPDGGWVRGRGLRNPAPAGEVPDRGLYLGGGRLRRSHDAQLIWPHAWIDWPDFLLPRDREQAIRLIRELSEHTRSGERVEVACGGGVGRTGTVIACLAILAGIPAGEAVTWTRTHYHPRAVETPWQRRWVERFPI
ncbi:protein-tyrosine phosphatase family protein [Nonomuraea sp. NPDC048826]|uniref:protein-tyrosine phosphatase family protein n=1 Tax=Nonomuraea sp. NPDC048826 TaxID=3364347 RepID=UPI003724086B